MDGIWTHPGIYGPFQVDHSNPFSSRFLVSTEIISVFLVNSIYSPYWKSNSVTGQMSDRFCNLGFNSVLAGMHLVAYVYRNNKGDGYA